MAESITMEELMAAIANCQAIPGRTGLTITEMSDATGHCTQYLRSLLRKGVDAGTIECIREKRLSIDNILRTVPAYRVTKNNKTVAAKRRGK